jgi:hypothetical protein
MSYAANKALHLNAIPLRSIAAGELKRSPLAPLGENQALKTDAPSGHGLAPHYTAMVSRRLRLR